MARKTTPSSFSRTWRIVVIAALILTLPIIALLLLLFRGGGDEDEGPPQAAIVDQLSLTVPNPDFAREARSTLEQAGYEVDYYPGEDVTVEFYRRLAFFNYDVIVFRSHADRLEAVADRGEPWGGDYLT